LADLLGLNGLLPSVEGGDPRPARDNVSNPAFRGGVGLTIIRGRRNLCTVRRIPYRQPVISAACRIPTVAGL